MTPRRFPLCLLALWVAVCTVPAQVETDEPGEAAERHLSVDRPFTRWSHDPDLLDLERGDRLEVRQVPDAEIETVKLRNVIPPIRFESGVARIPPESIAELARVLEGLRDRDNVRVHFVGHADAQPLSDALVRVFGDNAGLSRERAGEVAEHVQAALGLPPEAISYEWAGDSRPVASNLTEDGRARNRRVEVEVWYDESRASVRDEEVVVSDDIRRIKVCRMETVCKLRYLEGHAHRARLRNLVLPVLYQDDATPVSGEFLGRIRQALRDLAGERGVTVRFVGHTDDAPLSGRDERIYGDHLALSKARALRVALAVQDALALPTAAVESDGLGSTRPIASNDTARGRAANRRVEVEFWYDDPLQELPDEPRMCPEDAGTETVTRVYDPPWGPIATLDLDHGRPIVPPGFTADLRRALGDVADRDNPRLRFVGYTGNERLDRRTATVYGDDIGLSAARARRAKEILLQDPLLEGAVAEHEGRGYVQTEDVVQAGFVQGETSFVRVQVVYDEPRPLQDWDGIDVTRITRELQPKSALELNVLRITVDGEPIDDPGRSSSDVQRCTDVALDDARVRFRFDGLRSRPRLAVAASPSAVPVTGDAVVRFRAYTNYRSFLDRAEVRIFEPGASTRSEPVAVVAVDDLGVATWRPEVAALPEPERELRYLLRVYDARGNFDETEARSLWLLREPPSGEAAVATAGPDTGLAAYGENEAGPRRIRVDGGTVHVHGSGIPAGHTVWFAGRPVPVDGDGNFVAEEILPRGAHTVEVAVLDEAGNGSLYLRDLEFGGRDLFYVGIADLTMSENRSSGPADLLQGADAVQPFDSSVDGRLAFFVDGEVGRDWRITASADTREGPVEDLFSNFLDKSPDALFRRIEPEDHYPTFGDDGTVRDLAPTQGKFFVKASRGENHALWGSFEVDYTDNELAQVDRGLYGANVHFGSATTTTFGERRFEVDGFAAEPGTLPSYEEFRGTGGSLYYLRHQDILTGSERLRIEVRDKDSGIVTGVVNLRPGTDYDVDALQGRVLLAEPLSSTVDDRLLVRTGGTDGDEAWLVVRYEYTPGFDDLDAVALGGRGHYWFGEHVRLGVTAQSGEEGEVDSSLGAADLTLRVSPASWIKLQSGRSEGLVSGTLRSDDGGFGFAVPDTTTFVDADAEAHRADVSVGLADVFEGREGRLTAYVQTIDAGYSAPGQTTLRDTEQVGGTFRMPVTERLTVAAKGDRRTEDQGLETRAVELDVGFEVTDAWTVRTGVRNDLRRDRSPVVPLTQDEGERTDAVVQVAYDPGSTWRAYGFVQDTLSADEEREDNGRVGAGGSYRVHDRFRLDGEVSDGDLGVGGRLGTTLLVSERTSLYLNYSVENERADDGLRERRGSLVSGVKRRLSDSSSVYVEERYRDGETLRGLTHAAGIRLAARERWNFGVNGELGTLYDSRTGADTDRAAGGARIGYAREAVQVSTAVEYRRDDARQPDTTVTERTVWLFRNDFKVRLSPDARLVGKLNHSESESSLGEFHEGGYTEVVFGYAYRPVRHDRWQALAKYTYFYNVPTTDQVGGGGAAAEFVQKSHIAAVDVSFDVTSAWSVGGKAAYRLGQVSLDRVDPEFFDNAARLVTLRADWKFRKNWESLIEARVLDLPDLDQRRSGALLGVYRTFGKHLKLGAGYNFTDFSDDLTDLGYDHQGMFVNVVGTL